MCEQCNCHHCTCGPTCDCTCHEGKHLARRYRTRAEQVAELEQYLDDLKAEAQAVEEQLATLRA